MIDKMMIAANPRNARKGMVMNPKYSIYLLVHDIPVEQKPSFLMMPVYSKLWYIDTIIPKIAIGNVY